MIRCLRTILCLALWTACTDEFSVFVPHPVPMSDAGLVPDTNALPDANADAIGKEQHDLDAGLNDSAGFDATTSDASADATADAKAKFDATTGLDATTDMGPTAKLK